MKKLIAYMQLIWAYLLLWPHAICFIISSKRVRSLIYSDIKTINDKMNVKMVGINAVIYVIFRDPFYRKMFYHRLGNISYLFSWYYPGERTFFPICSNIGEAIYLAHPTSTYLNARIIGKNFSCRQNVTIGNKYEGDDSGKPSIGDNVVVGANVCIIGDIKIGDNVVVGAGSVVLRDVPSNCVAVGNPARIIY